MALSKTRLARTIGLIAMIATLGIALIVWALWRNQHRIVETALAAVNKEFHGELRADGSALAPFAQFPYISIDLRDVRFFETKDSASGEPLYRVRDLYVGFDFWDVWQGNYTVKSLKIQGGYLRLLKRADGSLNILSAKRLDEESAPDDSSKSVAFDIRRCTIEDFTVSYHDEASRRSIVAAIENTDARFQMAERHILTNLNLALKLDIDENGKHTFFHSKPVELRGAFDFDRQEQTIALNAVTLALDKALFNLDGKADFDDSLLVDIKISGEKPSLNTFAAFAPPEVAAALERYKNDGKVYFSGVVQGKLSSEDAPFIRVDFGCKNVQVLNTAVNKKLESLQFSGSFTNGAERNSKTSEFRLMNIRAKPEEGVFRGDIVVRNFDEPFVNMRVNADLDLEFLGQFLGVEGLKRFQGQVIVDMNFNELVDIDMPAETLLRLQEGIQSELTVKNLSFRAPNYPHRIENVNGHAVMNKGFITMDSLSFQIAGSDICFDGSISDFPALLHKQAKPVEMTLNARSKRLDFAELLAYDTTLQRKTTEIVTDMNIQLAFVARADSLRRFDYLPRGEFFVRSLTANLKNYPHRLHDITAQASIGDRDITLKNFVGEIDGSDMRFSARMQNYVKWFEPVKRGMSKLDFYLYSRHFAFNDILSYEGRNYVPAQYRDEEIKDLAFRGSMEFRFDSVFQSLDANIEDLRGSFKLHPLDLRRFSGRVHYEAGNVLLERVSGMIGASDFDINAAFRTDELSNAAAAKSRPTFIQLSSNNLDLDALFQLKKETLALRKAGQTAENKLNSKDARRDSLRQAREKTDSVKHAQKFNIFALPFPDASLSLNVRRLRYQSMNLSDILMKARVQSDHFIYLDTLTLAAAGGVVRGAGYFNGSRKDQIYLSTRLKADRVDLNKLLFKLDNFGQDMLVSDNITGLARADVQGTLRLHPDLTPILSQSEANVVLTLKNGELKNFAPMQALARFFHDKNLNRIRFDTLENTLAFKNGTLTIPQMAINSSLGFFLLSGEQGMKERDYAMDYVVEIPLGLVSKRALATLFGGGAQNQDSSGAERVDSIYHQRDFQSQPLVPVRVQGTLKKYNISLSRK
jgi:hypothetical protein